MNPKYEPIVNRITDHTYKFVLSEMRTENRLSLPLFTLCVNRGWSQADLVLALLRANTAASLLVVSRLIGRPITYCPPALRRGYPAILERTGDLRRVRVVRGNPRLPGTGAHRRFDQIKPGRSVQQLLSRGVTRRDIRQALANKWMRLENGKA